MGSVSKEEIERCVRTWEQNEKASTFLDQYLHDTSRQRLVKALEKLVADEVPPLPGVPGVPARPAAKRKGSSR